jgi:hypothetical protein
LADINEEVLLEEETQEWNMMDFYAGLYGQLKGFNMPYDAIVENNNLIDLNNNPKIPSYESLRNAIINYKDNAELLQDFSEFMKAWDTLYAKIIDVKLSMLSFDVSWVVDRYMIKDPKELSSKEFQDDYRRVCKFMSKFKSKQEFREVAENMLISDTYFCWLRDSYGTFNDDELELDDNYKVKKSQNFALQMMPQEYCKITGSSVYPKTFLWDFNVDYFDNAWVNVNNYDPSLKQAYESIVGNKQLRSFVNSNGELNKISKSFDGYVRTRVSSGAYCFKYDTSNFNAVPPFAKLMREAFTSDELAKLQRSKDALSANALILGEMKTKKDDKIGNEKNSFIIDPKQVGTLLRIARNMVNNANIKQIALPLEETRLYQFNDMNPKMVDNRLTTIAGQSISSGTMIYTDEKMGQFEQQNALALDYHSVADRIYPQFENFLEYFVNKKTKKYKFKFRVDGSTLPFLRQDKLDNQIKLSNMGIQADISKMSALMGYDSNELEAMMMMAKYGGMQDSLVLLMNNNTSTDGNKVGNPEKSIQDKSDNGSTSDEYN